MNGRLFSLLLCICLPSLTLADKRSLDLNLFGTTHGHSNWSIDAFGIGNQKLGPEVAYQFARGDKVTHLNGNEVQLKQPLDFFMLSDHAEMMGTAPGLTEKGSAVYDTAIGELVRSGKATEAFTMIGKAMISGKPLEGLGDPEVVKSLWKEYVAIADRFNKPGVFTTFPGYEWTSLPGGANMHRNIIFRSSKVPKAPFSAMDSDKPEELWTVLESWRAEGIDVFAISHNGNGSLGKMFGLVDSDGTFITKDWANRRNLNEPQHEAGQVKGSSMAHPMFSPNDEFADFELWNRSVPNGAPVPALRGNYVREGWKIGLGMKNQLAGINPYQFGVGGGSDSHATINTFEEFNNQGNHVFDSTLEARRNGLPGQELGVAGDNLFLSPGTLTGVWVAKNDRGHIFDAMKRRESYATSGTRIKVRLFAGYDLPDDLMSRPDWVDQAYSSGAAPMGGVLPAQDKPVKIAIQAMKAPHSGNLDRIQIIKVWSDGHMEYEKIFNVAMSDGRVVDPQTGSVDPVPNTVDLSKATYTNQYGATQLQAIWADPSYIKGQDAAYYARVLEIPTPRWSTYDAVKLGLPVSDKVPPTIQERAWTSPIWISGG